MEAAEAQLDTVAQKLAEVQDVTQIVALVDALAAKQVEVDAEAFVNTVANTLGKVKAVTLGDTVGDLQAH